MASTLPFAWSALPAMVTRTGFPCLLYLGVVQLGIAYPLRARRPARPRGGGLICISMLQPR